jgi:hypothetical protein
MTALSTSAIYASLQSAELTYSAVGSEVKCVDLRKATGLSDISRRKMRRWKSVEGKDIENLKNGILWDVTPFTSCKNLRFGGT